MIKPIKGSWFDSQSHHTPEGVYGNPAWGHFTAEQWNLKTVKLSIHHFQDNAIMIMMTILKRWIVLLLLLAELSLSQHLFAAQISKTGEKCDILIVGGGLGGVSAALQASRMAGRYGIQNIIITEETDWLGGQYTTQGVTASDDSIFITHGKYEIAASKAYFELHETIRDLYRKAAIETARQTLRTGDANSVARRMDLARIQGSTFSPGNPWGSLSFLPRDGVKAIDMLLEPYIASGILEVRYFLKPARVLKKGDSVTGVEYIDIRNGGHVTVRSRITLDATELGELLPLSGSEYRVGIEASSDTREPSLFDANTKPLYPRNLPNCTQAFTYTFALEWTDPDEDHRLPWENRPQSYEQSRHRFYLRPYLFARENEFGNKQSKWPGSSFWTYRRMVDAMNISANLMPDLYPHWRKGAWIKEFAPQHTPQYFIPDVYQANVGDIAEINWASNDFAGETIIDVPQSRRIEVLKRAKDISLSFLYWLWYEAPRDTVDSQADPSVESNWSKDPVTGKNRGFANLKLRPDIMGTADGLSKTPYIRESRRIKAVQTILQQHIIGKADNRARIFHDSVGIGHYAMDLHPCDMGSETRISVIFKPNESTAALFQIPWSAMVPERTNALIPACKNIGTTHITNGAYRVHPVEFQIGQSAGACAVLCLFWNCQPRDLVTQMPNLVPSENEKRLRQFQHELLKNGVPIFWNTDCGWNNEYFEASQFASLLGIIEPHGLLFEPNIPLTRGEAAIALAKLFYGIPFKNAYSGRFIAEIEPFCKCDLSQALTFLDDKKALLWLSGTAFDANISVTKREFKMMIAKLVNVDESPDDISEGKLSRGEAAKEIFAILSGRYEIKDALHNNH